MATRAEIMNSKLLDIHHWSEHGNVKKGVEALAEECCFRDRRYMSCLKVLLLNLYLTWRIDPDMYVAYSRDEKQYNKRGRFSNRRFSYDVLIATVEALLQLGYIDNEPGSQYLWDDVNEELYQATSRMRATRRLIRLIVKLKIKTKMVQRSVQDDVIVLKSETRKEKRGRKTVRKKDVIEFTEEPNHVSESRRRLEAYNALLQDTYIDVDDEHLTKKEKGKIRQYDLDLTRKRVYRIFSNAKWDEGGRFYRAWWMGCPKILRKYIVINGDYTVELDYSGIHIQLLYAMKGINYAAKQEDAYTLDGFPYRDLNKLVFLTAINAKNELNTVLGVWNQLHEDGKPMPYGLKGHDTIYRTIDALKAKHPQIADMIASGEGVRLQFIDSQIAEHVVEYFTERRIPILTVHDSFICAAIDEHVLLDQMKLAFTSAVKDWLQLNYKSHMELIKYDTGVVVEPGPGDMVIQVDKICLSGQQVIQIKKERHTTYKQGRRFYKYRLTGNTDTIARVTNKHG